MGYAGLVVGGLAYSSVIKRKVVCQMAKDPTAGLGEVQIYCLKSMAENSGGKWSAGCGWVWDNPSGTARVMLSLWRRGLVDLHGVDTGDPQRNTYVLNELGQEVVDRSSQNGEEPCLTGN